MATNEQVTPEETNGDWLLELVERTAISPEEAAKISKRYLDQARARNARLPDHDVQDFAAEAIVKRFARWASGVGGATGVVSVVPGMGTVVGMVGGGAVDAVACMKIQVDMCMCLASTYGYDLTNVDARRLSFLIASTGTLNRAAAGPVISIGGKAGVRVVRTYLKGAALQAVKEAFRRIGVTFTRKALEKAIPFGVGVLVGAVANYGLTKYVGNAARDWFIIDRGEGGPAATLGSQYIK